MNSLTNGFSKMCGVYISQVFFTGLNLRVICMLHEKCTLYSVHNTYLQTIYDKR